MTLRFIRACTVALCILALPDVALAQRALHWDNVEVTAHLDAEGRLVVTEAQTTSRSGFGDLAYSGHGDHAISRFGDL